ncbi:MAG TPA: hypothetical protein DCM26_05455 [Desulfotomaculum sp.]|nr:hypothetical protein [Desulfotomaculum sp.]
MPASRAASLRHLRPGKGERVVESLLMDLLHRPGQEYFQTCKSYVKIVVTGYAGLIATQE